MKLKKGDKVVVITGDDKGKSGEILKVYPKENRVLVSGINMVTKHQKPNLKNNTGGIIHQEAPIHCSNVMYVDPVEKKPTRIRHDFLQDGKKIRVTQKSNSTID